MNIEGLEKICASQSNEIVSINDERELFREILERIYWRCSVPYENDLDKKEIMHDDLMRIKALSSYALNQPIDAELKKYLPMNLARNDPAISD